MTVQQTPASIVTNILENEKLITTVLTKTLGVKDPIQHLRDRAKKLAITKGGWFAEDEEAVVQWLIRKNIKESVPGTLDHKLKQNRVTGIPADKKTQNIIAKQTRQQNELKRNLWVEKRDDEKIENLISCIVFLSAFHPELVNSLFCNWLDQWASSYWKHLSRREMREGAGNGDWDFGTRVYPIKMLALLVEFKKQNS